VILADEALVNADNWGFFARMVRTDIWEGYLDYTPGELIALPDLIDIFVRVSRSRHPVILIARWTMLLNEIKDSGLTGGTECHGKDADETPYASFGLDIEFAVTDRADEKVSFGHRTRASLKMNPRQL